MNANNATKIMALEMIATANSGHSGVVMSMAEIMYTLYTRHIVLGTSAEYINRDRVVLSAGHASALLYATLYTNGLMSIEQISKFRQYGSDTAGHPEIETQYIDASTGPLGQGVANAVGMAIAESNLSAKYDSINHYTYCIIGDGCLMEGIAKEAISIAGHYALDKLIMIYDRNRVTLDGELSQADSIDHNKYFESNRWNVIGVNDGHNIDDIDAAITLAKAHKGSPTVIICDTIIGKDTPYEASHKAHGAVLTADEIEKIRDKYEIEYGEYDKCRASLYRRQQSFDKTLYESQKAYEYDTREKLTANEISEIISSKHITRDESTRKLSGYILNEIANVDNDIMVLSPDVSSSTYAIINDEPAYTAGNRSGRNVHMGICEHAMAGIANGIAQHTGLRVYVGCFLAFCDYMRPSMRMACIQKLPVTYILTHDSIMVGEDGPTHQPVEQIDSLRIVPNMTVIRPANATEVEMAYSVSLRAISPVSIILSRQVLPYIKTDYEKSFCGAYLIDNPHNTADLQIIASGSELHMAITARDILSSQGVNAVVISVPSIEMYKSRPSGYRDRVVNKTKPNRIAVEASTGIMMRELVGDYGEVICIDRFGASAPAEILAEKYGININNIVNKSLDMIERNKKRD